MAVRDRDSALGTRGATGKVGAFVLTALVAALVSGPSGSFLAAPIASAHAELESSTPAEGDVVADIVDEIELVFTEPIELIGDGIEVLLPDEQISEVEPTTEDDITFLLTFDPPIGNGEVGVRFEVISADGHAVSGSFAFTIDDPTPESTDLDPIDTTDPETSEPEPDLTTTSVAATTTVAGTTTEAAGSDTTASVTTAPTTVPATTVLDEAPEIVAAETATPTTEADEAEADSSNSASIIVIGAILAALAAAIGGMIYARRRGGTSPSDPSSAPSTEPTTDPTTEPAAEPSPEPAADSDPASPPEPGL